MARKDNPPSSTTFQKGSVLPEVGRPRGAEWKALQDESIEVESQVQVVGDGQDLAARLILTKERLVLAAGGQIIVEFPRTWLRPQARLLAENGIRIFVTPEGIDVEPTGESAGTERITLRARDGRGAAASLVRAMSGITSSGAGESRASLPPVALPSSQAPRSAAPLPLELPSWRATEPTARTRSTQPEPPVAVSPSEQPLATRMTPNWASSSQLSRADARQPIPTRTQATGDTGSISAWTAQHLDAPVRSWEQPTPVPAAVSRAARQQGTAADGRTIREDLIATPPTSKPSIAHRTGVWVLRAAVVLLFLGGGAFLGRDYLRDQVARYDLPIPAQIENGLGIAPQPTATGSSEVSQLDAPSTETPTTEVVNVIPSVTPTQPGGDNILDDKGGTTGPIPTASIAAAEPTTETVPTEVPVTKEPSVPTEVPVTEVPTDIPATEAPTDVPVTAEPTNTPVEPTATETESVETPTAAPSETPTETASATATTEPTATATATEGPAPTPTLTPQPPSVEEGTPPDQQVAADGLRYSLEGASFGESVPELPQINAATGYGNWLVLRMSVENTTGTNQVFDMSTIKLYADGQEVLLDEGTSWVNQLLGITPAYGNTESILWAPGESHDVALTFLAPLNVQNLTLSIGGQSMDLSNALTNPSSLFTTDSATSAVPESIEAKVVKIVNGETIVVEIDGVQQTVRYLGVQAPTDDDCFASEATAANAALVEGKTVRIERQATNVDPRGNWVRDVWAPTNDGRYALVSASLVAEGAVQTRISEPNTRFSSWLLGSEAAAKAQGLGLWQSCGTGNGTSSDAASSNAATDQPQETPMPTIAPVTVAARDAY